CAFFPGFPVMTRTRSPGWSVKPGSSVPTLRKRPLPRPTDTEQPAVENALSPIFSTTNHSSLSAPFVVARCISRMTSRMAGSLHQDLTAPSRNVTMEGEGNEGLAFQGGEAEAVHLAGE